MIYKVLIFSLAIMSFVFGQTDLENNLKRVLNSNYDSEYIRNYVKGYMQPFVTAFGTSVCGAMYHRATVKEFPRFDAGISAVYIKIPENSNLFTDQNNLELPTIFGSRTSPEHDNTLPGGIGLSSILIPQLQINLGLLSGFEGTVRYMNFNVKEFGDISLMGFGMKYGFGEFMPIFPIDLSIQAMYHKFSIGDWLDSGTIGMNLQLSKKFPVFPIDFYGGVGFENTLMVLKTEMIPIDNVTNFDDISIDGENNFRINLGLSWTLAIFNVHADYNFGRYNSLSFGAMIVL